MIDNTFAYKFTDKVTGEVLYGRAGGEENGIVNFRCIKYVDIPVNNPGEDGHALQNDEYNVELVENFTGQVPEWASE